MSEVADQIPIPRQCEKNPADCPLKTGGQRTGFPWNFPYIYISISADPSQLQGERVREKVSLRPFAKPGLAFNASLFKEVFYWRQKAMLGSSMALKPPRLPRQHFGRQPSGHPAQYFGHLPDAFKEVFYWLQRATLGSSLPLNAPRRPCQHFVW